MTYIETESGSKFYLSIEDPADLKRQIEELEDKAETYMKWYNDAQNKASDLMGVRQKIAHVVGLNGVPTDEQIVGVVKQRVKELESMKYDVQLRARNQETSDRVLREVRDILGVKVGEKAQDKAQWFKEEVKELHEDISRLSRQIEAQRETIIALQGELKRLQAECVDHIVEKQTRRDKDDPYGVYRDSVNDAHALLDEFDIPRASLTRRIRLLCEQYEQDYKTLQKDTGFEFAQLAKRIAEAEKILNSGAALSNFPLIEVATKVIDFLHRSNETRNELSIENSILKSKSVTLQDAIEGFEKRNDSLGNEVRSLQKRCNRYDSLLQGAVTGMRVQASFSTKPNQALLDWTDYLDRKQRELLNSD